MPDSPRESPAPPPPTGPNAPATRGFSLRLVTAGLAVAGALLIGAVAMAALIGNARLSVAQETQAAFQLARITATLQMPPSSRGAAVLDDALILVRELDAQRHVSARAVDPRGAVLYNSAPRDQSAPEWFARMIRPEPQTDIFAVIRYPAILATLHLTTDPYDEIAKAWQAFRIILPVLGAAVALMVAVPSGLAFFVIGRLRRVTATLGRIEAGDLTARATPERATELRGLTHGVNTLARHLAREKADNDRLTQRLLHQSEVERARIASDLHDRIGPQLFALRAATLGPPDAETTEAIARYAAEIQAGARAAIRDLRPMAAGDLSLAELLEELVAEFREIDPALTITLDADPAARADGLAEISAWRFVRESVLNALRHGGARDIAVRLSRDGAVLILTVSDDGRGPARDAMPGMGQTGIADRARALGSDWTKPVRRGNRTVTELRINPV